MSKFIPLLCALCFALPIGAAFVLNGSGIDLQELYSQNDLERQIPPGTLLYFYAPS
ncbi:MAG: hypothetical protein AAGA30_02320 [Planctomycetota bacterium]